MDLTIGAVPDKAFDPPDPSSLILHSTTMPRTSTQAIDPESKRLREDAARGKNWKRWGPYLSERQWGTVREDYSPGGACWESFPHDHARSRVYRWGEDGLLGITDRQCRLCFAFALWNEQDPILKERLFGLTGVEGSHGEDVKECYYYLDSTPTHSYMKALYKYPQGAFPYAKLVQANRRRRRSGEYELIDTGIFDSHRYFDVFAEYAKVSPDDILIRITVANRGPDDAPLHVLPTLWYRNTWIWGCTHEGCTVRTAIDLGEDGICVTEHESLGKFKFAAAPGPDRKKPTWLFTENDSNTQRLWGVPNKRPYVKDSFHDYVIHGRDDAVNPKGWGTKVAAYYKLTVPAGEQVVLKLRLWAEGKGEGRRRAFGSPFDQAFARRIQEADTFYAKRVRPGMTPERVSVARQAYAGLLWTKQFYHYVVEDWLEGDPNTPPPPEIRKQGRNHDWPHLFNRDVISMPDKWEYPWYAAWDLAFHMIPFARIDPQFAKDQLVLFLREWYMHPNGQIPAYEFALGDVNPPVHAWACWRIYKMTGPRGRRDHLFLSRCFQKLLLNFTWWVNRKDIAGKHLFAGGFLGLDNIGVFDRSQPLPTGGHLEQADGTAWMAFYCSTMLAMALELARFNEAYEDTASKFLEHFVHIADAINTLGGTGLWDEADGFYYDQLHVDGRTTPLRIRSLVGLMPLIAAENLEDETIGQMPGFQKRLQWFLKYRSDLAKQISYVETIEDGKHPKGRHLLAIPSRERLLSVLKYMLDENEFLSPYGIRSVSKYHERHPYVIRTGDQNYSVQYVPGESKTSMFGGNSNWRGPIWFPINFLIIEALERYHHFYGEDLKVECPSGSGQLMTLKQVALEIAERLCHIFLAGPDGARPCHGGNRRYAEDPHWRDLALFYEYFHGDTGRGVGASHQTGWTALAARCLEFDR